jgi:hypothetical protein
MKTSSEIRAAAAARASLRHGRDSLWQSMNMWAMRVENMEEAITKICRHFRSRNLDELWMNLPPEERDDEKDF